MDPGPSLSSVKLVACVAQGAWVLDQARELRRGHFLIPFYAYFPVWSISHDDFKVLKFPPLPGIVVPKGSQLPDVCHSPGADDT